MRAPRISLHRVILLVVIGFNLMAIAQTESTIYTFQGSDGANPWAGMILDQAGNLYGTTSNGGTYGNGTVFELMPTSNGWQESVLYSFRGHGDGKWPYPGLVMDSTGNLYGVGFEGGPKYSPDCINGGCGVVFELSPAGGGTWIYSVLYTFTGGRNGYGPLGTLVLDSAGNLYGTTREGGDPTAFDMGGGVVFELAHTSAGWKKKTLYAFHGLTDGAVPYGGVTFDSAGNLYGNATLAGDLASCSGQGCGVVYELSPTTSGMWNETVLHTFTGSDGVQPYGSLIFDPAGNLYGATYSGGAFQYYGTVFMLSPSGSGWSFTTLHSFQVSDGEWPQNGLFRDAAGNLYGTTVQGGAKQVGGVAYELSAQANGTWKETILADFSLDLFGGSYPLSNLVADSAGNLYGTTEFYGSGGAGIVFKIGF
ncbi:MAG TPA: choice-of-anchor tandem repeat GloVer-containing protein [Terriglobales bacterium]|nr:choice-of-anchor tandem repeat GloVer-containing protein [Terriglobales bacterium]